MKKATHLALPEFIMCNVGIAMLPSSRVYSSCLFGIKIFGELNYIFVIPRTAAFEPLLWMLRLSCSPGDNSVLDFNDFLQLSPALEDVRSLSVNILYIFVSISCCVELSWQRLLRITHSLYLIIQRDFCSNVCAGTYLMEYIKHRLRCSCSLKPNEQGISK